MKGGQNLAHLQQKKKEQADTAWIHPCKCMVCGKDNIEGYHGRWGNSGTCNATCEKVQAAKYPYPTTAEAFEALHNL